MDNSIAMQVIKRLLTCLIISISLLFLSNIAWLIAWCSYEYEATSVEQYDARDNGNTYIHGKGNSVEYVVPENNDKEADAQERFGEEENEDEEKEGLMP